MKAVLDEVASLRLYAAAIAPHNLKDALKLFRQADQLELAPSGETAQKVDDAALIAEWEQAVGGRHDDPEMQAKVYRAIEEMRRREQEEKGKIDAQRADMKRRQSQRKTPGRNRAAAK